MKPEKITGIQDFDSRAKSFVAAKKSYYLARIPGCDKGCAREWLDLPYYLDATRKGLKEK